MDTTPRTDGVGPASLTWEASNSGMTATGQQYEYLIATAADGITRLTRWGNRTTATAPAGIAADAIANSIVVADPDMGKLAAQAYENRRSIHGQPMWQRYGTGQPDFYARRAPVPGAEG